MPFPITVVRDGFTFQVEQFAANRWRTRSVTGHLVRSRSPVKGKRKGNLALCQFDTDSPDKTLLQLGEGGVEYPLDLNYDGGHLIALDLGGTQHPLNLVPMPSYFNRHGEWRNAERYLCDVIRGKYVTATVEVGYPNDTTPVPNKLTIKYEYAVPPKTEGEMDTQFQETLELIPQVFTRQRFDTPQTVYDAFKQHIPAYCQANGLLDQHKVPYSFLTYLNEKLNYAIIGPSRIQPREKFTKEQRLYIWSLNCWNNNAGAQAGYLVSDIKDQADDKKDRYAELNTKGCLDFPQVDHFKPANKGGSNSFANCQLTSAWYNNQKRDGYIRTDADWEEVEQVRSHRSVRKSVKDQRIPLDDLKRDAKRKEQQKAGKAKRQAEVNKKRFR
jgi:hypothetical protein